MKYKIVCSLLAIVLCISAVGCGAGESEESVEATVTEDVVVSGENTFTYEDDAEAPAGTTLMAMVESVEGNVLTLSVNAGMGGEMPQGEAPFGEGAGGEVPEMPEGETPAEDGTEGEVPEMPEGEAPAEDGAEGEAPEMPEGEAPSADGAGGDVPEMPEGGGQMQGGVSASLTIEDESVIQIMSETGENVEGTLEDITAGSMLSITFDEDGVISAITVSTGMGMGMGQGQSMGGMASGVESYEAVVNYTEDTDVTGEDYQSEGTDENAIHVSEGASVTLSDITVNRTSQDSTGGDNSSFYGVGAAILNTDGELTITNAEINTDAAGGAGVFAYGDGVVTISDSTITTTQNTSGGIHVAGGGTLYAKNLTVETDGESAAAIRSDRGGGTMVVDGGTYISNGLGSPALYCTADIAVNGAVLTATGSEAICMEGLNTIHLFDCDITGDMLDLEQNDTTWTIIVYQSMSGDSEVGNSTMQLIGGSLTSKNGGLLYTTNTESDILMSDVDITYSEDSEFFLMATGNANERGWGQTGANGANCRFTAISQDMQGNIIWDSISTLDMYMTSGSTLTGAVVDDETYAGNGGDGYCNLYISSDSTWIVTGDSTVTNLYAEGCIVDEAGNAVSIVGTDGTVYVQGSSAYTITVETYQDTADLSGASQAADWADYE